MMATHSRAMMTVQRFRFFSATPEEPAFWGESAAEHVGQAAAFTLVHKDKQGEQEAEDDKKNLQHKLDSSHSGHG